MELHGAFGDVQLLRDFLVAQAGRGERNQLCFARGEALLELARLVAAADEEVERPTRVRRLVPAPSGEHGSYAGDDGLRGFFLEHDAIDALLEGLHILRIGDVGGEEDELRGELVSACSGDDLEPIRSRHMVVHDGERRAVLAERREGFLPCDGRGHDIEIGFRAEECNETPEKNRVVIGDDESGAHDALGRGVGTTIVTQVS